MGQTGLSVDGSSNSGVASAFSFSFLARGLRGFFSFFSLGSSLGVSFSCFRRILNRNRSPGLVGKDVYDDLVYHLLQLIKESTGLISSPLDLTKLLLPKTRQLRAFQQFLMDRADQFRTGSGGIRFLRSFRI